MLLSRERWALPHWAGLALLLLAICSSDAAPAPFAGAISASLTRRDSESRLLFTTNGKLLRVEDAANKVAPVNIVDFAQNRLTIVYPDSRTYMAAGVPNGRGAPAGPAQPLPRANPTPVIPGTPSVNGAPGPTGSLPPGFPSPPAMPNLPQGSAGAIMPMPPMPAMPGLMPVPELKKTDQTRKILGFECSLYQVTDRGQLFEVWATSDSALFPFRMLERRSSQQRFGPVLLEEQWPELLRKGGLFPLEATLRDEDGTQQRLSFKVEKVDKQKTDDTTLFNPPEGYQELRPAEFR